MSILPSGWSFMIRGMVVSGFRTRGLSSSTDWADKNLRASSSALAMNVACLSKNSVSSSGVFVCGCG